MRVTSEWFPGTGTVRREFLRIGPMPQRVISEIFDVELADGSTVEIEKRLCVIKDKRPKKSGKK